MKSKILEAEKEKLVGQVKEITDQIRSQIKNLQSPTDIPPPRYSSTPASKHLKSERFILIRFFGLYLFGSTIRVIYLRTSRIESPIPIRKQPAGNRRDRGCQTDLALEPREKPIEKIVIEEAREEAKIEFDKILKEERKQHLIEVTKLKKKQWCAMCLKEGM